MDHLEEETKYYEEIKPQLLKDYEGKVVAIKGSKLLGVWDSFGEAYTRALEITQCESVLIKQVLEVEPIMFCPSCWIDPKDLKDWPQSERFIGEPTLTTATVSSTSEAQWVASVPVPCGRMSSTYTTVTTASWDKPHKNTQHKSASRKKNRRKA